MKIETVILLLILTLACIIVIRARRPPINNQQSPINNLQSPQMAQPAPATAPPITETNPPWTILCSPDGWYSFIDETTNNFGYSFPSYDQAIKMREAWKYHLAHKGEISESDRQENARREAHLKRTWKPCD